MSNSISQIKKGLITAGIKARVYNEIRSLLYKEELKNIPDNEKLKFFDHIFQKNIETHQELNNLKAKRKFKAQVQRLRAERGYKPKKKTSLIDYQASQRMNMTVNR